ncbi:SDR family NAD(P)-dependent oxidoreductase [Arthrobacter bambusae]|uniref:SDR family NAD(P)-dependent oxidoreductase n=1 Tax=Arthrobacter bambusae TaxID=1338426 RepID=UPI002788FB09|nr:SDR family oxidoreductase [Arthrobacter bambusae]MDQ0031540.1 NAD(P)-dependent dehydrogenase (short-subunit alcohol dehydrogenase family) [Arthrobacter bambusae]MDQ0099763.1 NAD(P)-dependent dehydrogenase (short-subunit alcohol dehydrogenase family) [Arthrobacter bambusae]
MGKFMVESPVAFVIGATRGIGKATASRFLEEGYVVAGTHRGSGVGDGVRGIECDVTEAAAIKAAFKEVVATFGRLDTVVYNAGVARQDLLIRMRDEDLRLVMETNLFGAFTTVQESLKYMGRARSGSILLISSESSRTGIPGSAHYTSSKAALDGLVRSAMWEAGPRGIRINVVAPGPTKTDMLARVEEADLERLIDSSPLKRIAEPEEIADAIFKISTLSYLTGALIPVTGGEGLGY